MPTQSIICTLCGVECTTYRGQRTPQSHLPWLSQVRAVVSQPGPRRCALTGLGYVTRWCLRASNSPDESYLDAPQNLASHKFLNVSDKHWSFIFHDDCWQMLVTKIRCHPGQEAQTSAIIAAKLFDVLYCFPWERRVPRLHDFTKVKSPIYKINIPRENPSSDLDFLTDQPFDFFRAYRSPELFPQTLPATRDCFSILPKEIKAILLELMSSVDVCNLRLASRSMVTVGHRNNLTQSFWASRFQPDREMGFFSSGKYFAPETNWKSFYVNIRQALMYETSSGQLRNRRRIWRALDSVADCMIPLLKKRHEIFALSWFFRGSDLNCHGIYRGGSRMQTYLRARVAGMTEGYPAEASPLLFHQAGRNLKAFQLLVSFQTFNFTTHICGLRLLDERQSEVSRAGIILSTTERKMSMDRPGTLEAVHVISSTDGVVGIRLFLKVMSGEIRSLGAGLLSSLPSNTGVATLTPTGLSRIIGLKIGTDACKVVSVQLIEIRDPQDSSKDYDDTALTVPLWHPFKPNPRNMTLLPRYPKTPGKRHSSMILNMNFGGRDGSRLALLTQVFANWSTLTHPPSIHGIGFVYADKRRDTYGLGYREPSGGSNRTVEVPIDGPGGERIVKIRVSPARDTLKYILLWTNRQRALVLKTALLNFSPNKAFSFANLEIIEAPWNCQITGFIAEAQHATGHLRALGAVFM